MRRVLLVEDDALARWVAKKTIENMGYFVTDAENCGQANELLQSHVFDCVVADHRLPDGFGLDVIRGLRLRNGKQKAIYLTAEPEEITENVARDLKIEAVLSKPIKVDELLAALSNALDGDAGGSPGDGREGTQDESEGAGRFAVLAAPTILSSESVDQAINISPPHVWLALDMSKTIGIDEEAPNRLAALAGQCRDLGGRLCLLGVSVEIRAKIRQHNLDNEVDIFPDMSWLEPAGRRQTSACERSAVLKSAVKGKD